MVTKGASRSVPPASHSASGSKSVPPKGKSIAPKSMPPKGKSIAPKSKSIVPKSIVPKSIVPKSIAPKSIVPRSIAPRPSAPHQERLSGVWHKRSIERKGPDIWAVAGGKGGVGKSVVAGNLALTVAQSGLKCLLVDADLGGGNQHTLFGERMPECGIDSFLMGQSTSLAAVCAPSRFAGLSLAFTQCDALGAANPKHSQKQKLIRHLNKLEYDVVILDLGAGTNFNTLDLFLAAQVRLVVTTPEPTAVQNAYGFIKCAAARNQTRDEEGTASSPLHPRILVNSASEQEADLVFKALSSVTTTFLGREPSQAGFVRRDPAMHVAVVMGTPVMVSSPTSVSSQDLRVVASALLEECFEQQYRASHASSLARGRNEELRVGDKLLHVQTEDLGENKAQIRTQVFDGGRVIFSKVLAYGMKQADGRTLSRQQQVEYQHRVIAKALVDRRVG